MEELLKLINGEIDDFSNKQIQIVPGFLFNQKDTIEKIYLYYNSKYKTGEVDTDGDRKFFYNISRNPAKVYTKAIDFDTKHINILTAEGQDELKTWFFERDLKFWFKDKRFGKVLNRIFDELPVFGSVVLKIVDNVPYFVDLRNFFVSQSADTLDDSLFITEIHRFTVPQFRKVGKQMGWKNIEEAIEKYRKTPDKKWLEVYERYGEVEEEKNGKKEYAYKKVYVANVGKDEYDQRQDKYIEHAGVVLEEKEIDEHPYFEFHLEKIPGRWLGVGVVEALFEPQIKQNETANLESKAAYHLALLLFQTRDNAINRNLLKDSKNGDVINSDSEITQIGMTYPNLSFFIEQTRKWLTNRDELTFSYDVVQGERLPSGTPLGSAKIAASMAISHFDQVRENIALDIKELLYSVILPNFEKESKEEHILRIAGEDLDTLNQMIINQKSKEELIRIVSKNGKIPDKTQYDIIKLSVQESVKQGKEKLMTIPRDFYKGLKYAIDIIITGESKDTSIYAQTLFAALQAITADPMLLQDPAKKKFFYKYLENGGLNPNDFFGIEQKSVQDMMPEMMANNRAGGGVSRPTPMPLQEVQRTI